MPQPDINAIIFDLGGVIVNLDVDRSVKALVARSEFNSQAEKVLWENENHFQEYERGTIGDQEFREGLRTKLKIVGTDQELDEDWNAMLLDIPQYRINLVRELGKRYRTFILSNTNQIHVDSFESSMREHNGVENFRAMFEKVYYSHQTGYRKPEKEIYDLVLRENGLNAAHTVFIDDNADNIASAGSLGIQTIHMKANSDLREYLRDF